MLKSCFLLISIFHDAFVDHDNDREKHEGKYLAPVNNETFIQEWALPISAMYGRNFKPKAFTDITIPAKQSCRPNIGKIHVTKIKS